MNAFARAMTVRSFSLLIAVSVPTLTIVSASAAEYKGEVAVKGSYHTTQDDKFNDYNGDDAEVTIKYVINTKIDPTTKMPVFDPANSYAVFVNEDLTTVNVPITAINGNPATGAVTSFKFKGTEWDPKRLSTGKQDIKNDGIDGEVVVNDKTADIKAKYIDTSDNTKANYTFATNNKKPEEKKNDPKTGNPISSGSITPPDKSIDYDAMTKTLSITDDKIVKTPDPSDPILGASVNFSSYQFTGITSDGSLAIFHPTSGEGPMSMTNAEGTLEQGDLPVLFYDVQDNLFYTSPVIFSLAGMPVTSPFYDPSLAPVSSPFFNSVEDVLDPSSPYYDPNAYLAFELTPTENLFSLTDGFTVSGGSGANDLESVAGVPEPSAWIMMATGFAGLSLIYRRRPLRLSPTIAGRAVGRVRFERA